jgi:hypothetical protein
MRPKNIAHNYVRRNFKRSVESQPKEQHNSEEHFLERSTRQLRQLLCTAVH